MESESSEARDNKGKSKSNCPNPLYKGYPYKSKSLIIKDIKGTLLQKKNKEPPGDSNPVLAKVRNGTLAVSQVVAPGSVMIAPSYKHHQGKSTFKRTKHTLLIIIIIINKGH